MATTSAQGVFNLLILGFGLTGPYRKSVQEGAFPFGLDPQEIWPPSSTADKAPVVGTISARSTATIELAPHAVLSLLRGLLTFGVAVNSQPKGPISENTVHSELSLLSAEFLQKQMHSYLTAETDPRFQDPRQDTSSSRGFYGLADSLGFSLSYISRLLPPGDVKLLETAEALVRSSMMEHPEHPVFARNTSQNTLSGQTRPDLEKCRTGPLMEFLASASHWSFWRDWYQGFLDGKPLDWELQRRVALIPDDDWEKGPEHIGEKIKKIRDEFDAERAASQERHKELEPSSVDHLLSAPKISAAQIEAAAHDISEATCRYLNESGANDLPDAFQNLPAISRSLQAISANVQASSRTSSSEEQLRAEIGRLNAHVLELEAQIAQLKASGDPALRKALKEQAGKSLGDWKMYAAMLGAVWMISGDTVGMKARLENLNATREAIFGTAEAPIVEPIDSLPQTTDI